MEIEDLIKEIESTSTDNTKIDAKKPRTRTEIELDALLDEINFGPVKAPEKDTKIYPIIEPTEEIKDRKKKCFNTNIPGCSALKCLRCDFKVLELDGEFKGVDYLFFRNNYPNTNQLKTRISQRKDFKCFCCQCSWASVQKPSDIKQLSLKWVCSGH
ncbi:hypothetical protein HDV01_001867 [Terramyces sp. JEL0728]|nr:hypothetical protein HDV01_001867 [Terramyces sp. JEL0728]